MNVDPVKRYLSRVKAATASRAKEIRMPTEEAQELANALGELLAAKIETLQGRPEEVIEVQMDGGTLKR